MAHPPNDQENERNMQAPTLGAYEPFARTYSDFDNMLSADNAFVTHSLSPSGSFHEHLSPETMLSDTAYSSADQYGSLDMADGNHMDPQQFNELLTLSDHNLLDYGGTQSVHNHSASLEVPQPPTHGWSQSSQAASTAMQSSDGQPATGYGENARQISPQYLSPSQGSPAGSASSRQLISPVVRVESYEETLQSLQPMGGMNGMGHRSQNHLSPFDQYDYESDDETNSNWRQTQQNQQRSAAEVHRSDDGSWIGMPSGQKGISPDARNDLEVPTLDELQERRQLAEKKADVEDWLARSEVGSETDEHKKDSLAPYRRSAGRRRAKSTNDLGLFNEPEATLVPGPGAYLNVPSDYEEDDDSMSASDEPDSPPARVELQNHNSYFPTLSEESLASGPVPWVDPPTRKSTGEKPYQPPTANAAMMRFKQRAKDIESASLAATLGSSRRRSESDMGSVLTAKGVSRDLSAQPKDKLHRMESLLQKFTPRRVNSNQKKRKGASLGMQSQINLNDVSSGTSTAQEAQPSLTAPKRIGSWGKPMSPKLDTSPGTINAPTSNGNTLTVMSPSTPWGMAKNAIRRSRSRSELSRSRSKSDAGRSPGLGELMTAFGGPPMPVLASPSGPSQTNQAPSGTAVDYDEDSGEEGGLATEGITMDLAIRPDPIIPTYHGFHTQARQLNPRIPDYLLERVSKEQINRYQRLIAVKAKHVAVVKSKSCPSKAYCFDLDGKPQQLKPRVGNRDADTAFQGFQIIKPGMSSEAVEKDSEGMIIAAQFPSGVPLPPVDRLPAEFECPLCFKVKKFYKPSDWTKHVHEDVQPFTCTFPSCNEPKSFKRKADWVRHENERHRQLENWTCDIADCVHTCFRKDNFVQHLVREHKIPEPKARTGKGASGSSKSPISPLSSRNWVDPYTAMANPAGYGAEDIWMIVERCRRDTTKQPHDEPCRFCGNMCNSWKKLTVHLAKHMEQISMPILPLISKKQPDSTIESGPLLLPQPQRSTGALTDSPQNLPTYPADEPPTLDIDDALSQASITPGISVNGSQVMHTYPPPQYLNPQYRAPVPQSSFGALPPDASYAARSYPGPMPTSRQHSPSGHSSYSSSVQCSNYPAPRSVGVNFQQQQPSAFPPQQAYDPPAQSNGFSEEALSAVDNAYLLSSGQVSTSQSPVPASQQNGSFQPGFGETFTFPSQHYSNTYGFGGTTSG